MSSTYRSPRRNLLSASLDHHVSVYCVAAAAAGVSVLALAPAASAEIVITNKQIPIPACYTTGLCPVSIDFNKDGVTDLQFSLTYYPTRSFFSDKLTVKAAQGAGVMAVSNGSRLPYASCLLRSAKIGPSDHFETYALIEGSSGFVYVTTSQRQKFFGDWGGSHPNRFLGVKFQIKGKTHYGWVRITVTPRKDDILSAKITEYGYETIANKPVSAGLASASVVKTEVPRKPAQPPAAASLGMLALGADSLPIWRRE